MRFFSYGELTRAPGGGVIALGFFDGVHIAHRRLLSEANERARKMGVPFGIFTFRAESGIKKGAPRLYSTEERIELFESTGADFAIVADFCEISSLSAEEFVKNVLIEGLGAAVAFAGYNFRFGRGAMGNADKLSALMRAHGGDAVICEEITSEGEAVSATVIRSLIEAGEIESANRLLGAPYFLRGRVIRGNGQGRSLGFPTVNTSLEEGRVVPRLGVYRSLVRIDGRLYNGVTNVGRCPTFGKREIHAETYIIDFHGDIYGESVTVYLVGYLREEKTFESADALIMQIEVDKNITIKKNEEEKWQELGLK